jgi:hypothetical protein
MIAVCGRAGKFDDSESETLYPGLKFSGLFDVRFYRTDRNLAWLQGGYNRLRYGGIDSNADGEGDRFATGASIPQASLVIDAQIPQNATIHIQTNYSSDAPPGTSHFGIVEAYASAEKAFDRDALRLRAGGLIPPMSWEHPDVAWSTRYTLTPSAIGSWVGEEVRALGAEGVWERELFPSAKSRLTAGLFSGGDHIGYLLWLRGWTLDDYQGSLNQEYFYAGKLITPSQELDGRLGYYGRADFSFFDHAVETGGGYWTNNANDKMGLPVAGPATFDNFMTQPFRVSLFHYGGKLEWRRWALISQYLKATITSLSLPAQDYYSAYVLGSAEFGRARLSARYDRFWIPSSFAGASSESGHAFTLFAGWSFTVRQQVAVECIYANARPAFANSPETESSRSEVNRLLQLNYRLKF